MPSIITSRTQAMYGRQPIGPVVLNRGCQQAQGLVGWWPLVDGVGDLRDYSGKGNHLTETGSSTNAPFPDGGFSIVNDDTRCTQTTAGSTPVTGVPFTMAVWAKPTNYDYVSPLMSLVNSSNDGNHYFMLGSTANTSQEPWGIWGSGDSFTNAKLANKFTLNEWCHTCAVLGSATSRSVYMNGGGKATDTTSCTPTGLNQIRLGRRDAGSRELVGNYAHACVWNRAISDAEVYRLYDPGTRWELYYRLGAITYVDMSAAAATGVTRIVGRVPVGVGITGRGIVA